MRGGIVAERSNFGKPRQRITAAIRDKVARGAALFIRPLDGMTAVSRNVLLFRYGENVRVAMRPSGTEPKAKVYLEVSTPPCSDPTWAQTCPAAEEFVRLARVGK